MGRARTKPERLTDLVDAGKSYAPAERRPGDGSSSYAGVSRTVDAVTFRVSWCAQHDGRDCGSFDDVKVAARAYDFARHCHGKPAVNFDGSGEGGETFCAYCEDWELRAVADRDEKPLIEKYGRRFFEDPDRPGEVYYVVHTGVQWTDTGMPAVKVDAVGPRDMSVATPGPFVAGPRAGMDVAESATTCFIDNKLRRMIAATPQGLQIKTTEDGAAVPQPFFSEFIPPEPVAPPSLEPLEPRRRRPVVVDEPPPEPAAPRPPRAPRESASAQRKAALDAEDAADGWTPPSEADSDPRCLRACDACRAAGLGVKACLVGYGHAAGVAPPGFSEFCAEVRAAPAYREPDGPPSEGAVCAAVQAAVSGVAVPAHFVDAVKEFANRESKLTTVIQGGRRSVYVDGGEAGPFRDFADGGALRKGERRVSRRTNATKFLERCRCAIAYRAAYLWPRSHAVHLSADMLCLVGAPAAQVPHVDLIPDQCQAVMALTRQAPTLVLRKDASPSIEEAFAKVGIDAGSTTKWADLVRAAPALALGRDEINRGMVDATRYLDPPPTDEEVAAAAQAAQGRRRRSTAGAGGVDGDCRPVSRDAWDAGSLFLADHRLVHAGPRCTQPGPRVVLFTTFTVQSTEAEAATYDPRDQYMPYFLAEDPSMSDEKAAALLHHWREEKPWDHYPDTDQSLAVKLLATRGPELSEEKRRDAVARMRATPPE